MIILCELLVTCTSIGQLAVADEPSDRVRSEADLILNKLAETNDIQQAKHSSLQLFDRVTADFSDVDAECFREAGFVARLTYQLALVDDDKRPKLLEYLQRNRNLAMTLAFLICQDDNVSAVYRVLDQLRIQYGDELDRYANLAAAICVVHDRLIVHRVNENSLKAEDPVVLYAYYRNNEQRMMWGVRDVPAELLIYVVDNALPVDQMQWSLDKYAFHREVGSLFFQIEYDIDHLKDGRTKRVTREGWSMPNVLKYGGVCADQTYFAVAVGKSIGVPAVYTIGHAGEGNHAWVGYLKAGKGKVWWDFNDGRSEAFKGVKGMTQNPQTGQWITDSFVSLFAEMNATSTSDRQTAVAMIDAASRLAVLDDTSTQQTIEELIVAGLKRSPGYAPGWLMVSQMAKDGRFSINQKLAWIGRLRQICGGRYPDFVMTVATPVIESIEDIDVQQALWQQFYKLFNQRKDLATDILMKQGQMWLNAGDMRKAGQFYETIIDRYADDSPMVLYALDEIEKILIEQGQPLRMIDIYERTWKKTTRPSQRAFGYFAQSNWYRIGMRLVKRLEESGQSSAADKIRRKIEMWSGARN